MDYARSTTTTASESLEAVDESASNPYSNQQDSHNDSNMFDNNDPVEMDTDKSEDDNNECSEKCGETCSEILDKSSNHDDEPQHHSHNNHHRHHHKLDDDTAKSDYTNNNKTESISSIIQVTNISPSANLEQLTTLFGILGEIVDIELYDSDQNSDTNLKVCFVEFAKHSTVLLAQHLTNTVFVDRALVVLPYVKSKMPDRDTAISDIAGSNLVCNFNHGVISQAMSGVGGTQVIATVDPRLIALGLPQYPHLPVNTDPTRIEEIRRTVYIGNLDSTISPDQVMKFFNDIGEVKYIRMAGDDTQPTRFAFVEFTHQSSVANALQHNGFVLGSRALKINHSNNAIVKPQPKLELDDLSKRVHQRDNLPMSGAFDPPSKDRHQSYRYDRTERREDRQREKDRDRYRDRRRVSPRDSKSRRSRSRDRDHSSRRRSRSRDRTLPRRNRSGDRSTRSRRSRSRDSRRKHSRSKSRERSRSKHHKSSRR